MRTLSLSARALLAALLPTAAVAVLLAAIFLLGRVGDLEDAHRQRATALAQQLAASVEFALFTDNRPSMRAKAERLLLEPDVYAVAVLDVQGQTLVALGTPAPLSRTVPPVDRLQNVDLGHRDIRLTLPVVTEQLAVDDAYAVLPGPPEKHRVGYVELEVSYATQGERISRLMLASILITLFGLLLGTVLAVRLSRRVTDPIRHIGVIVDRIGRGDLDARVRTDSVGSTRALGEGVNRMAERIGNAQNELQRRIDEATGALRQRKEEAEQATLAKSRFLASASHDLRQPLHAMGMFIARLRQLPHPPEARELIANVERSVDAMQGLLNALLDISRLDAGSLSPRLSSFPVAQMFQRLATDLAPKAEEKGLDLRIRPSTLWLMSDAELLYRIVLNLATNAIAYTLHGGILVACRRRGRDVRIEVWDTGIGIDTDDQETIFKEFVQLDNPERDRNKGLGLGLAIVRRTAELLGHPLHLCSRFGQGSRFSIDVSYSPANPEFPERRRQPRPESGSLGGISVLVIDDDLLSREAMRTLLAGWGCVVATANGPAEVCSDYAPDVLICDYRLAGAATGISAISDVRRRYAVSVPACLVSGDTDVALIKLAAANDLPLLHKPVRPARLQALVRRLARREAGI